MDTWNAHWVATCRRAARNFRDSAHNSKGHHTMQNRTPTDRRSGIDRRQVQNEPPASYERRRTIEPRQPEVVEIELSPEELIALGFDTTPKPNKP